MFPTGFINFARPKIGVDGVSDDETESTSPILAGRNVRRGLTSNNRQTAVRSFQSTSARAMRPDGIAIGTF